MRILLTLLLFCCVACSTQAQSGNLPDPKMTPGDTLDVSKGALCAQGYTKLVRDE
jgi:hypothetical protein